jgi:hypothetical protein
MLDSETLSIMNNRKKFYPAWTFLSNNKCLNCPLSEQQQIYCPAAVHLVDVVDSFKSNISIEKVNVEIATNNRVYHHKTSLQSGLRVCT